jgi:16S rRNA U1498 N3-methylase RsmE
VVTPTELLSLDNRGTITGTFAFKHMLSVERAMESDITRLFDDGDVQADTIKFTIHMSTEQAAVPGIHALRDMLCRGYLMDF